MLRSQIPGVVALALLATGCGERQVSPPRPSVRLTIDHPADTQTVDDSSVEVSGHVTPPDARVLVDGSEVRPAPAGDFQTTVSLEDGVNVIDIEAGADRRPSAMTALRVTREVRIEIPVDITDSSVDDALQRLDDLGLHAKASDASTLIDALDVLGTDGVCGTDPSAGSRVLAGTTVTVYYARHCSG